QQLFEDFAGRQVSLQAGEPAGAEDAAHAAADLRADAGGVAILLLQQDAFDQLIVLETQQELVRAVGGAQMPGDTSAEDLELGSKSLTQSERQVGHLLERLGPSGEEPAAYLAGAQWRLSLHVEPGVEFFRGQVEQSAHGRCCVPSLYRPSRFGRGETVLYPVANGAGKVPVRRVPAPSVSPRARGPGG